jgi:3-deoxy-D-manno-octulosonic-acid transferase
MYFLYSALLALALLLGTPYWIFEMLRHGKYRRGLGERFGFLPPRLRRGSKPSIWVHAVSVGEVLAVSELIRRLRQDYPEHNVVVSTTTDTGQKIAGNRFGPENVFYFPFDFKSSAERYFEALRPELIVVAETEFWPNFLRVAKLHRVRVAVVNARISDRSFPGYRRWRFLLAHVLRNIDLFLTQTAEDARRLTEIGAPAQRIFVGGNLKFDVPATAAAPFVNQLRSALKSSGAGPVLVCGSTVDGEESPLLNTFKAVLDQFPCAVLLLAPRHPERFEQVANLLEEAGVVFTKRSAWKSEPMSGRVLLVDSIGELASLYSLADIAFVGGSLVPRGGHSILEPAQHGVAILVGPHTENFRDIVEMFRRNDAVRIVDCSRFSYAVMSLLSSENDRRALGRRAFDTFQSQRGATELTIAKIRELLPTSVEEAHRM